MCEFCEEEYTYDTYYAEYRLYMWGNKLTVCGEKMDTIEIQYCPMCGKELKE